MFLNYISVKLLLFFIIFYFYFYFFGASLNLKKQQWLLTLWASLGFSNESYEHVNDTRYPNTDRSDPAHFWPKEQTNCKQMDNKF